MAGEGELPAIVLFSNDAPRADRNAMTPEDKVADVAAQNSLMMKRVICDSPNIEDMAMAVKLFRIVAVDVSGVDAKASPAVNRVKAPATAVIGVDGKVVKAFTGICTKAQLLEAMTSALKPRLAMTQYLEKERKLLKDLVRQDALEADLKAKQEQLRKSSSFGGNMGGAARNLATAVAKLEEQVAKAQAETEAQVEAIDKLLAEKGVRRLS